ncbi:unnamed protein product [Macrosiphum euphorbiae]|nr:unnamed protein product [Macrosiphum euphorbiae]
MLLYVLESQLLRFQQYEGIPVQCEEVEVLLSTWNRLEFPVSFEEFVHFDDNVSTAGNFTDEEIIQSTSVNQHNSNNNDD